MIPKIKSWKVTYYAADGDTVCSVVVDTINKNFARWLANDKCGYPFVLRGAHHSTCSLVRKP